MFKFLKPYLMPFAIALGAVFDTFFKQFDYLIPYLIFLMLFFPFTKIDWRDIKLKRVHLWLILLQIVGSIVIYLIIAPFNKVVAEGVMICIIAPTATAAPVIVGMLKGNVESLVAYSLLSNIAVAITGPILFYALGEQASSVPFFEGTFIIAKHLITVVLIPLLTAFLLKKYLPKINGKIASVSILSFWFWAVALTIVTGKTVSFMASQNHSSYTTEILLALGALFVTIFLFAIGKFLGKRYNDTVAAGQSLGQKNTVLAIWIAQTYFNPLSSIAPGMYVIWQNTFNSWQIWRARKTL